jgi:hypothetical protein
MRDSMEFNDDKQRLIHRQVSALYHPTPVHSRGFESAMMMVSDIRRPLFGINAYPRA